MDETSKSAWFDGIDRVVADPLRFKKMLAIGENAYATLRLKNKAVEAWEIIEAAGTAATVAKSSVIASTFFAPSGWISLLGIGTAATPIGWVIVAGVAGGGAWWGITQYMKSVDLFRVDVIPEFINTPLDTLALGLFDLFAPMALKIAHFDGSISEAERKLIKKYFVDEWGYDERFVSEGVRFSESRLSDGDSIKFRDIVESMAILTAENPDCQYDEINKKVVEFLKTLVDAEQKGSEVKEMAIETAERIFDKNRPGKLPNKAKHIFYKATTPVIKTKRALSQKLGKIKIAKKNA